MKCTKDPSVLSNSLIEVKDRLNVRMTSDVHALPQIISSQRGQMGKKRGLSFQLKGGRRGQMKDGEQEGMGQKMCYNQVLILF